MRREAKEYDAARRSFLRALEIREAALGPKHPGVADVLLYLGNLDLLEGDLDGARRYLERSLALNLEIRGPEHPMVANCDTLLGRVDYLAGRRKSALQRLERALALREKGGSLAEDYAETRFFLAQALWDRPKERPRALELARARGRLPRGRRAPPGRRRGGRGLDRRARGRGRRPLAPLSDDAAQDRRSSARPPDC
ncbi:MAG: tetratricopeptide repeat protein [Myxococcales bacterium]|nr:tetratricopeptide repeat protein [Myxococcales bacterium]